MADGRILLRIEFDRFSRGNFICLKDARLLSDVEYFSVWREA
jgi:hypothetical protein